MKCFSIKAIFLLVLIIAMAGSVLAADEKDLLAAQIETRQWKLEVLKQNVAVRDFLVLAGEIQQLQQKIDQINAEEVKKKAGKEIEKPKPK